MQWSVTIYYNQNVAVGKGIREMDVVGISNKWNMVPVAFLLSWNWVTILERERRYRNRELSIH
jgi:hypothetical protein